MRNVAFITLMLVAAAALAQRSKPAVDPLVEIDAAIEAYDFARAESLIAAEQARLKKKRQPSDHLDDRLALARRCLPHLSAVEQVVVFDSLVLPHQQLLSALCLSRESGRVMPTAALLNIVDERGATLFRSEMGDKAYYALPTDSGALALVTSDIYGNEVTPPLPLPGLEPEEGQEQNYPYMMPDGQTLYFAQTADDALGGYDIYMSRYDPEERRFYAPQNVGMPFNSPANDYMLCIDEAHNIGCWATDRNQPADTVCVYYFVPNPTRRVMIADDEDDSRLRAVARLCDISLTWGEELEVRAARSRLADCRTEQETARPHDFTFVVTAGRVCHFVGDFRNQSARAMAQRWAQDCQDYQALTAQLDALRLQYRAKPSLASQILSLEQRQETMAASIRAQEKAIRKAELGL